MISHAWLHGFGTHTYCLFPFALPWFAPTAVPQVLASNFRFSHFPSRFDFLSSILVWFSTTQLSVSLFPFHCLLPHSGCLSVRLSFRFFAFPIISYLISHVLFPGFRTRLTDGFLSLCPASLPQPFHRWFPSIALRDWCMTSVFFTQALAPHYSAFCFSLSFLPGFASQRLSQCSSLTFALDVSPLSLAWFLMHSFPVSVLDLLMVSFRSTLLRSRSRSTGDSLDCSLGTSAWLQLLVSALAPTTQLLFLPFHYLSMIVSQWLS